MSRLKIIAIATVTALAVFFFLSWLALGNALFDIMSGKYYLVAVGMGTSMYPYIQNGDLLLVDAEDKNASFGDVIVYVYNGELIGHRVLDYNEFEDCYIVGGDYNRVPDPWCVSERQILGKIERIIHNELLKYIAKIWLGEWT